MDKLDLILGRQTLIMKVLANIIPRNSRVKKIFDEWDSLTREFSEAKNETDDER